MTTGCYPHKAKQTDLDSFKRCVAALIAVQQHITGGPDMLALAFKPAEAANTEACPVCGDSNQ